MARGSVSPERALLVVVAALLAMSLLPSRLTSWAAWFQEPVRVIFAPISDPMALASRSLRRASVTEGPLPRDVERLQEQLERQRTLAIRLRSENRELRERLRELQSGLDLFPPSGLRLLDTRVIGASPNLRDDVLVLRGGRREGVTEGDSVAVVDAVHLLGRVIDVENRTCEALPITSPNAESLGARVYVSEPDVSFACQLDPTEDGRLRGPLHRNAEGVEPGQPVRLDDPDWPDLAQALIIGLVESVERSEESPLRRIVTVKPRHEISRVRRVTLRLPAEAAAEPGTP